MKIKRTTFFSCDQYFEVAPKHRNIGPVSLAAAATYKLYLFHVQARIQDFSREGPKKQCLVNFPAKRTKILVVPPGPPLKEFYKGQGQNFFYKDQLL